MGKSTLLGHFIAKAHEAPFKDYCLTASVDERQATPISMMEKLAQQLHLTGKFEKALKQYREALQRRQVEQETLHDKLFDSVPDMAGAAVEGIPVAGPFLREGARVAALYLLKEHQESQVQQATELLEAPIDDLTRAFVTELKRLADTNVILSSTGQKRERRIILFFDTFEQLAAEATPWFLDYFLASQVSSNVVLVVAGRDPIEHTSPEDPKRWLPYCDDGTIYWISLNNFTEDETRVYLVKREITDADQMANIWHLSRGLPLYLGLLTSNPRGIIDPTKGVVINFLRWIPEQEHMKRQLALDAALFSKPFNQDDLEVFSYVPESDRTPLYEWLTEQPFVQSRAQDGRYLYHDVAQSLFSRHLYQRSQKRYYEIRRALATYYQELLENIQEENGREVYHSEEWLELLLAVVFQLLLLPDQANHIKAIEHIVHAYHEHTNQEQDSAIARFLRDISQEPSPHPISSTALEIAVQLLHYVEDYFSQSGLAAAGSLIEKVAYAPAFPSKLLAIIYYRRARAYNNTRSELFDRELAVENFQQALKLFESTNYDERGWAYFYSGNYREALVVHEQALAHNPQDVDAYFGRGWAYLNSGEYQRAVEDFEHVLELAPDYDNPGGLYNGLRWAYYRAGKYPQALAANDSYSKVDPEAYGPHIFRVECYLALKDYQQAMDACNHALELAPNKAEAYFQRGLTYLWLKDLGQAQADFARSCELEPTKIDAALLVEWAGMCLEAVDLFVSERLEAIATVDPEDYTAHICQGIALLLHRNLREALTELEQALLPTRHEKWQAHFWKGMISAFLEQDEEAIAAIEKALDLELPPILLAPLHWFEQERPDFYEKHIVPLLAKHA